MSIHSELVELALPPQSLNSSAHLTLLSPKLLKPNPLSLAIYGDPGLGIGQLAESIRQHGILVPLVVLRGLGAPSWTILSGHRRWTCALALGLLDVPCEICDSCPEVVQRRLILEYNRQRQKTFTQLMREADAFEHLLQEDARCRRVHNLRRGRANPLHELFPDSRNSDAEGSSSDTSSTQSGSRAHVGRTDVLIARELGLGGKDLYRQARAIWHKAREGDIRAQASIKLLDTGAKTIHAAYKDLRRRTQYTIDFKPTPYDVWTFRHNKAFGVPHPGSVPPGIVAHTLHYFVPPGGLVIDPMAGGGTVLDVCEAMGRRCIAYDLTPVRPDIRCHDIRHGFPEEASNCDLVFCDPPYYTMLASSYTAESISSKSLQDWLGFLREFARNALQALQPGGILALLLAPQTEKDLPPGYGYLDHTFLGYLAATDAGFIPLRRISCPMNGSYLPQQVRQARVENRLLGQVRDLLVLRKPPRSSIQAGIPHLQSMMR